MMGLVVGSLAAAEEESLTLEQAIALALSANRTLAAAGMSRGVTQAAISIAKQRPNPDFTAESERETPHEAYTLAVPIETSGKRRKRVDLAEAAAGSNEADIARLVIETRVAVRRAYYNLAAAERRVAEMEEVVHLAQRTSDAAKERYASGDASRLESLQVELTLDESSNELSTAQAMLASARIGLNTLLARAPDQPVATSADLDSPEAPTASTALELAQSASVQLVALDRRIEEEQARVELAKAQRIPDLVLDGALTRRSQPEFDTGWRAGVTVELPILNQHRAEVSLAESSLAQLRAQREAALAQVRASVSAALVVSAAQRDQYARYRDRILPKAADVERMAAESYEAGQTGLVMMLQAFASVRDIRLRAVEAWLNYQYALADLELAIGAPLP